MIASVCPGPDVLNYPYLEVRNRTDEAFLRV